MTDPVHRLERVISAERLCRVIEFDDAPFERLGKGRVGLCGVVCAGTRFEGMVYGHLRKDGWNANRAIERLLVGGKFLPQAHLVLLDGIAFGGFNVVDLPALASRLGVPCAAVMRDLPDLGRVEAALRRLPRAAERLARLARAGPLHSAPHLTFQVAGAPPEVVARALAAVTDRGHVPEALRLAHLIAGAIVEGQSGRRA
jgi:endonuclease V-like protein UPF0215 family